MQSGKNGGTYINFCSHNKINADDAKNIFSGSLLTVLACMQSELHAIKVLFYAELVGVATSGHKKKMAVTPFKASWPKTPRNTETAWLYPLQNKSYCQLKFYIAGI